MAAAPPQPGQAVPPRARHSIRAARSEPELHAFARLARDYHAWLGEDLCFQGIDAELAQLASPASCYAPPGGCILLAFSGGSSSGREAQQQEEQEPVGCVALRPLDKQQQQQQPDHHHHHHQQQQQQQQQQAAPPPAGEQGPQRTCEMKRLWVAPAARRSGLGGALVAAALGAARAAGYSAVVLDTLERLGAANRLYERAGFARCPPYYHNPLPGAVFWRRAL